MKKIRLLTMLGLSLLVGGTAFAQNRVSGVVTSSEDNQPLAGVVVQQQGTQNGVLTNADGSYTISGEGVANGTLIFSYAGMRRQEVAVAGRSAVNAVMQPDAIQAGAVTVTALGGRKQERKMGYAATTVGGEDLARTNNISPINALQGKVAGLQISTTGTSGLTGSPAIQLRGPKSLTKNNSPIFVIDGIVMENNEMSTFDAAGYSEGTYKSRYGDQMKNLNANDFESVTVLKGAAATSLYGSRGANGAIVITTKGGKARQGLGIEVNYSHEFTQLYQPPVELQNTYGMGYMNTYEGKFLPEWESTRQTGYAGDSFGDVLDGRMARAHYRYGYGVNTGNELEPYMAYEDNWKALFQTGQQDNVYVALTGGSEKATFRASYGYADIKGVLPSNQFKRHSVNVRATGQLNDILSTDFSLQYTLSDNKNPLYTAAGAGRKYGQIAVTNLNRNTDLQWYRDNYIEAGTWQRMFTDGSSDLNSLQNAMNDFYDKNETRQEQTFIASVGLTAQFNDWLDASTKLTYNYWDWFDETKNYGNGFMRGAATVPNQYTPGGGQYSIGGGNTSSYEFLSQIHANRRFLDDNLELDVRAFYEIYGNRQGADWNKSTNGGLKFAGVWSFDNTMNRITEQQMGVSKRYRDQMTVGVGGAVNLSWKDQVNLEVTARNDWLSTLVYPTYIAGGNNYSVFYPSVNAAWVFSDTFGIDPNIISYGKLRASWAQVGSGTKPYETTGGTGGYTNSQYLNPMNQSVNVAIANVASAPNYDLKPEIQSTLELGADVRFLDGRIGLDVAYYKVNTKNQILRLGAIGESGVSTRLINAGNIQNQGWELQLDFTPIRSNTVRWDIGLNWSRNRSKVIELHPGAREYKLSTSDTNGTFGIIATEGGAFGQIVSGPGYGFTSAYSGAYARFRATDDNGNLVDDPRNGKMLINRATTVALSGGKIENVFLPVGGAGLANYYHGVIKPTDDNPNPRGYNTPANVAYNYDVLGNVQSDFFAGFHTNVSVQIPNAGSLDFFAQIDGRKGGSIMAVNLDDWNAWGNTEMSMYGRDAEHGGLARTNYKGETEYSGLFMDGVFIATTSNRVTSLATGEVVDLAGMTYKQAVEDGHIEPMFTKLASYYNQFGGREQNVFDATYFALREVTVGYNFPERWIKHVGLQSARVSFSARNLCYLYNGLTAKYNPEAVASNNPLAPVDYSGLPFSRNFSINLNLRF